MVKTQIIIDGMHCTACALTIDLDLEELPGVKSARTNYVKQITEVEYDEQVVQEIHIREQIKKSGYAVKA